MKHTTYDNHIKQRGYRRAKVNVQLRCGHKEERIILYKKISELSDKSNYFSSFYCDQCK